MPPKRKKEQLQQHSDLLPWTQQELKDKEKKERAQVVRDAKENVFRACVVPAAYSLEEYICGLCHFPEHRLKSVRLLEDEVGYGGFAMKNLGKRILSTYFAPNPSLFKEIFGIPLSDLKPEGLLCIRPWHDEAIAVMAPSKSQKIMVNAIMRETLSGPDRERLLWQGNVLLLSSSLQPELSPDLGGVTSYALLPLLQDKLAKAHVIQDIQARWQLGPGITLEKQFGWLADLNSAPKLPQPSPTSTTTAQLEFMLFGWKQQRCLNPIRHAFEKCPGYHVVQYKSNAASPVFDARRPPVNNGQLLYHSLLCQQQPAEREGSASHYYTCAAGAACDCAHSLVEALYNPEQFKRQRCEGVTGKGKCINCDVNGLPQYCCAFWHTAQEYDCVQAITQGLGNLQPAADDPPSAGDAAAAVLVGGDGAAAAAAAAMSRAPSAASSIGGTSTISNGTAEIAAAAAAAGSRSFAAMASRPGSSSAAAAAAATPHKLQQQQLNEQESFPPLVSSSSNNNSTLENTTIQRAAMPNATTTSSSSSSAGGGTGTEAGTSSAAAAAVVSNTATPAATATASSAGAAAAAAAAGVPESYDEVDPETLRFLFHGPSSSSTVEVVWYYVDPEQQIQGPFAAADVEWWCRQQLLPVDLLICPSAPAAAPPTSLEAFWPLNQLLAVAAEAQKQLEGHDTAAAAAGDGVAAAAAAAVLDPEPALPVPLAIPIAIPVARPTPAAAATHAAAAAASTQPSSGQLDVSAKPFEFQAPVTNYNRLRSPTSGSAAAAQPGGGSNSSSSVQQKLQLSGAAVTGSAGTAAAGSTNTAAAGSKSSTSTATASSTGVLLAKKLKLNVNAAPYCPGTSPGSSTTTTPVAAAAAGGKKAAAMAGSSSSALAVTAAAVAAKNLSAAAGVFVPTAAAGAGSSSSSAVTAAAAAKPSKLSAGTGVYVPAATRAAALGSSDVAAAAAVGNKGSTSQQQTDLDTVEATAVAAGGSKDTKAAAAAAAADQVAAAAAAEDAKTAVEPWDGLYDADGWQMVENKHHKRHKVEAAAAAVIGDDANQKQRGQGSTAAAAEAPPGFVDSQESGPPLADAALQEDNSCSVLSRGEPATAIDTAAADVSPTPAASACTAPKAAATGSVQLAAAAVELQQQQQQQQHVVLALKVFDMHTANPAQAMRTYEEQVPTSMAAAVLLDVVQKMRPLHGGPDSLAAAIAEHAHSSSSSGVNRPGSSSSSSSSGWASVLGVWWCTAYPFPQLRSLDRSSTLGETASQGSLSVEVYCSSQDMLHGVTSSGVTSDTLPLLHQLVYCGEKFRQSLSSAVLGDTAGLLGSSRDRQSHSDALLQHLAKSFSAAAAQGLVWSHDPDWAVFNSGLGRAGDSSAPQLIFMQRRDWQLLSPKTTSKKTPLNPRGGANTAAAEGSRGGSNGVLQPWVASSHMLSLAEAAVWLKSEAHIPPSPTLDEPWAMPDQITGGGSRSGDSEKPWTPDRMAADSSSSDGMAAVSQVAGGGSSSSSSTAAGALFAATPSPGKESWRSAAVSATPSPVVSAAVTPERTAAAATSGSAAAEGAGGSGPSTLLIQQQQDAVPPKSLSSDANPQQQQQQQQQAPAAAPVPSLQTAAPNTQSSILFTDSTGASFRYGQDTGTFMPAASASLAAAAAVGTSLVGQQQQQQHAEADGTLGQAVMSGLSSFPDAPLMAVPVLPQFPPPPPPPAAAAAAAASDSTAAGISASAQQQQQQATVGGCYKDLTVGCSGLQLVLHCTLASQQQQWLQQQQQPQCKLLVAQTTSAEDVVKAVSQWLCQQQQQRHPWQQQQRCIAPVLVYRQVDPVSSIMTWKVLQSSTQHQTLENSTNCSSTGSSSGSSVGIVHPLGLQLKFSAVLSTLNMEVYSRGPAASLFDTCVGYGPSSSSSSSSRLLSDVSACADSAEYWGSGRQLLLHYLAHNFAAAAVQGQLFLHSSSSNGSSGGASSASSSSSSLSRLPLLGVAGLLAIREQREREQQHQQQQQKCLLLFNTGLLTAAGQQVLLLFRENTAAAGSSAPWVYDRTLTSFQAAAFQPLPAPAAAPAAAYDPKLPLHIDLDSILAQQQVQQLLQQELVYGGQAIPAAAYDILVQGAVAKAVLQLQRTPGMAVQLLAGGRLQFVLPLVIFKGEAVRLVLLVEQYLSSTSSSVDSNNNGLAAAGSGSSSSSNMFYAAVGLAGFSDVYGAVRASGPCCWVSWVADAVAEMRHSFVRVQFEVASSGWVAVRCRVGG